MSAENINATLALSLATLMLSQTEGTSYEVANEQMKQSSDMQSQNAWSTAARILGGLSAVFGVAVSICAPFTMGPSSRKEMIPQKLMSSINYANSGALAGKALTGASAGVAKGMVTIDQQQADSLASVAQGYVTGGRQVSQAIEALEEAIVNSIDNMAQAIEMVPVQKN